MEQDEWQIDDLFCRHPDRPTIPTTCQAGKSRQRRVPAVDDSACTTMKALRVRGWLKDVQEEKEEKFRSNRKNRRFVDKEACR